jgi:hypothetical protein
MDCDQFKCIGRWRVEIISVDPSVWIVISLNASWRKHVRPYILSPEEHLIQILYRGSVTGNLQMFSDIEDSSVYYEICLGSTV